jgi:hypothetical protein
MRDRGWREEDIELLVAVNPARLLTFAEEQGG